MKKLTAILTLGIIFTTALTVANAQMVRGGVAEDDHTVREEAEGKAVWERLQAKQVSCNDLSEEDFEALGEYFMGTMMGESHAAMNAMMISMMGEKGEEQAHLVMGKRLSGCDTSAVFSSQAGGFMPMMQMMFPLLQGFGGQGGNMMGNWGPWGFYGFLGTLFWIGLLILLFLAIVKLWRSINEDKDKNKK